MKQKFDKVEQQLRTCLPAEMKDKPNWVIVRTRENADTGRLDKFLISPVTGKFAESDNPETWADFDTACKYARENGGTLTIAWARTASVRHLRTKYCPNAARLISKVR